MSGHLNYSRHLDGQIMNAISNRMSMSLTASSVTSLKLKCKIQRSKELTNTFLKANLKMLLSVLVLSLNLPEKKFLILYN